MVPSTLQHRSVCLLTAQSMELPWSTLPRASKAQCRNSFLISFQMPHQHFSPPQLNNAQIFITSPDHPSECFPISSPPPFHLPFTPHSPSPSPSLPAYSHLTKVWPLLLSYSSLKPWITLTCAYMAAITSTSCSASQNMTQICLFLVSMDAPLHDPPFKLTLASKVASIRCLCFLLASFPFSLFTKACKMASCCPYNNSLSCHEPQIPMWSYPYLSL